ncbi:hypothetical protein, partial [Neokomagataea anthophila]
NYKKEKTKYNSTITSKNQHSNYKTKKSINQSHIKKIQNNRVSKSKFKPQTNKMRNNKKKKKKKTKIKFC